MSKFESSEMQRALSKLVREFVEQAKALAFALRKPGRKEAWRVDREAVARTLTDGQMIFPGLVPGREWSADE